MLHKLARFRQRIRNAFEEVRVAVLYARGGVTSRLPTPKERELLLTVSDLIDAGYRVPFDGSCEAWIARTAADGAISVKYSYEANEAPPGYLRLILITRIERERSSQEAAAVFQEGIDSYATGATQVGARFVFKGNLQKWCDNAYYAFTLAEPNETVVGCVLSFQKGRMVYSVILRGVILESEQDMEQLVYPFLERGLRWCAEGA